MNFRIGSNELDYRCYKFTNGPIVQVSDEKLEQVVLSRIQISLVKFSGFLHEIR